MTDPTGVLDLVREKLEAADSLPWTTNQTGYVHSVRPDKKENTILSATGSAGHPVDNADLAAIAVNALKRHVATLTDISHGIYTREGAMKASLAALTDLQEQLQEKAGA